MTARGDALRLYGTDEPLPEPRLLQAGRLRCDFDAGAVRGLWWGETEVLRGIAYLLRDENWGTAASRVDTLEVEESPDCFVLRFGLTMALGDASLRVAARIEGHADGRFVFDTEACADRDLRSSRCGFVVLHPASCAGVPLEVEHTDGSQQATHFPRTISPGQPVFDIRALRWSAEPGLALHCRLEAELPGQPRARFEMEDQRNWGDASFKTYVGSLLDDWPYIVPGGKRLAQSVRLGLTDTRPAGAAMPSPQSGGITVSVWGPATGPAMPTLGLGVPHLSHPPDDQERAAVLALQPTWLVVQAELWRDDIADQFDAARSLSEACAALVQLDLLCADEESPQDSAEAARLRCLVAGLRPAAVRLCPRAYLKSFQPTDPWPDLPLLEDYARAAAAAFPRARIGGGMVTFFTELNRKRQTPEGIAFIGHGLCPIIHAADERSVMQTLESLPAMADTVAKVWPGLGWRLGPVSLAAPRNPYGRVPAANPWGRRLPLAGNDPRHGAQFGAAWLAAFVATAAPLRPELLCLLASHGPSGPLRMPAQNAGQPGETVPAWAVLGRLMRWAGAPLCRCERLPPGITGLAVAATAGQPRRAMLVNTTAVEIALRIGDGAASASVDGAPAVPLAGPLRLGPYQVVFLDG